MNLRLATFVAACGLFAAVGSASAQFQQNAPSPCSQELAKLNAVLNQRGNALQAAGQRKQKPSPQEACQLLSSFTGAVNNMVKFVRARESEAAWCGIPPQMRGELETVYERFNSQRAQVCRVAAAPARPRGPSLSDALAAPVPNAGNIQTGRGTYDTLTGTPLGR